MANIAVRKENGTTTPAATPRRPIEPRWEPLRVMRDLLSWDPFREMSAFPVTVPSTFAPPFEVKETSTGYVFQADLPGIDAADVDVNLTGNRLTISGKREAEKEDKTDTYYTYERTYGSFARSFTLPDGIDTNAMTASLTNGVLTIDVKKLPEAQPKKIEVQSPAKKG